MLRTDAGLGKAADSTSLTAHCTAVGLTPKEGAISLRGKGCSCPSSALAVLPGWREYLPPAEKAACWGSKLRAPALGSRPSQLRGWPGITCSLCAFGGHMDLTPVPGRREPRHHDFPLATLVTHLRTHLLIFQALLPTLQRSETKC